MYADARPLSNICKPTVVELIPLIDWLTKQLGLDDSIALEFCPLCYVPLDLESLKIRYLAAVTSMLLKINLTACVTFCGKSF